MEKKVALVFVSLVALSVVANASTIYSARASADVYIDNANAASCSQTFDVNNLKTLAATAGGTCKPWMHFAVPQAVFDAVNADPNNLLSAKLQISDNSGTSYKNSGKKPRVFALYQAYDYWTEGDASTDPNALTWNDSSTFGNAVGKYFDTGKSSQITNDYTWPASTTTIQVDLLGGTAISGALVTFLKREAPEDGYITLMLGATGAMGLISDEGAPTAYPEQAPTLILEYIPEPATLTLLGLGALGLIRRRRN